MKTILSFNIGISRNSKHYLLFLSFGQKLGRSCFGLFSSLLFAPKKRSPHSQRPTRRSSYENQRSELVQSPIDLQRTKSFKRLDLYYDRVIRSSSFSDAVNNKQLAHQKEYYRIFYQEVATIKTISTEKGCFGFVSERHRHYTSYSQSFFETETAL